MPATFFKNIYFCLSPCRMTLQAMGRNGFWARSLTANRMTAPVGHRQLIRSQYLGINGAFRQESEANKPASRSHRNVEKCQHRPAEFSLLTNFTEIRRCTSIQSMSVGSFTIFRGVILISSFVDSRGVL